MRRGSIQYPGTFSLEEKLAFRGTNDYKGKEVVIVNGQTQSQAEYTTMAFQSSPNVTVIGSTTAGADGSVSSIWLPGGISTMISGINVLYPDGTETQRKGVKIDVPLKPTILGIKAGRDGLLEKAKEIINSSKQLRRGCWYQYLFSCTYTSISSYSYLKSFIHTLKREISRLTYMSRLFDQ